MTNVAKQRHLVADIVARVGYCPERGAFWWKVKPSKNRQAGDVAGCVSKDSGYRIITLDRHHYKAHILAWALTTGQWPLFEIDHRNRVRTDNRFDNLRPALGSQNRANSGVRRHNKLGIKGVQKVHGHFVARITVNRSMRVIGRFKTAEEAHQAYLRAAQEAFGEFARGS